MGKRKRTPLGHDTIIGYAHASESWTWIRHQGFWVVYTIQERSGRLKVPLYVGVTSNFRNRLTQHRRDKAWWPLAGEVELHGFFTDRSEAYEVEEQQIHALRPLVNRTLGDA